jgi:two-component system cell cycle response regulator
MLKILAVDDQPLNLEILREMLNAHSVRTAQDGSEAIRVAQEFLPDLILLDVMMPILGGLETCRRLRQLPELHECSIVMVSAKAMASEREEGLEAGADEYLTKPFDEATLQSLITSLRPHAVQINSDRR